MTRTTSDIVIDWLVAHPDYLAHWRKIARECRLAPREPERGYTNAELVLYDLTKRMRQCALPPRPLISVAVWRDLVEHLIGSIQWLPVAQFVLDEPDATPPLD